MSINSRVDTVWYSQWVAVLCSDESNLWLSSATWLSLTDDSEGSNTDTKKNILYDFSFIKYKPSRTNLCCLI